MATTTSPVATLDRSKPGRKSAILVAAGIALAMVVLFATMLGGLHLVGSHGSTPGAADPAQPNETAAAPVLPDTSVSSPTLDLTLPQPTAYVRGVPVGYPNSQPGAIAAAYGYSRIVTGLDVAATLRTVETMADPASTWLVRDRSRIADGLVAQRRSLGLPASGSPGMALINVNPSGYRVEPAADGSVTVLTLNLVDTQNAEGTTASGTVVFRWALTWNGNRWLARDTYLDESYTPLAVTPFTSEATVKGWKVARGG